MVWLVLLGVAALAVVLTQWAPALGFASVVLVVLFVIGGCVGLAVWVGGWE
jgi:hypothetical protein